MPGEYFITPAESEFPDVEDGKYRAAIDEIAVEDGQWGEMLRWKFRLLDDPYPDVVLSALTSPKLTPKSKLWPWVVAMGYDVQLDVPFNIMELEGQECYVMVERKPDKNDPSKVYSNVTKIVPPPKAPGAGMPQAAPAPAPMARTAAPAPRPAPTVARPGAPAPRPAAPAPHGAAPRAGAPAPRPSAPPPRRAAVAGGQEDIPF